MRPLSPAAARLLLGAIVAAFVALAVNASLLLPLWEPADEYEHWQVIEHWATRGTMPDLTDMPVLALNEGVQPPLAYWMFTAGAHALGIADTVFLARRADLAGAPGPARFLHGVDEIFPFAGPARRFHLLRMLDVLCGVAVVCGAYALGRRAVPGSAGVALGAAALVAFNPAFVSLCGGLSNDPLAIALATFALLAEVRLARDPAPTRGSGFAVGTLVGLAHLAKLSATFLLPLLPLALLLRRPRGEPWRVSLRTFDGFVAGFAVTTGLYFAWNVAHYGDPFGWSVIAAKFGGTRTIGTVDALLRFLPAIARSYIGQLSGNFRAAPYSLLAFAALAGLAPLLAALTPVRRRMARAGVDGRVMLLFGAAVAVNLVAATKYFLDFNQLHGRYLHPTLPALACLVAACWCWMPRLPALCVGAGLALLCFHAQVHDLGPAYWPPSRARDAHFMAFDPIARVPEERRLSVMRLAAPKDGSRHVAPPELRWKLPDDPDTRFTVHFSIPGLTTSLHTWEEYGLSMRDRYTIPDFLWNKLPPDVPMTVRVIELPTLDEALAAADGELDVQESEELTLRRVSAPSR